MIFKYVGMFYDILDIFKWYLAIQILGIAGFILGYKIFSSLTYKGFCVSKSFGLLLFAIITWFIFNKKIELLEYSTFSLYLIVLLLGVFSYFYFTKIKSEVMEFFSKNKHYIFYIELAFLLTFILGILLRTYTPNIEGTEKPLEFVVINSILRTDFLPPIDAWLSGNTINYYYLGQYIFCNIMKLSFIDSSIGFNLVNPTVLSLILVGSFGFIYEITKSIKWALLASFMTGLMGNLEPIVQIFTYGFNPNGFRWWDSGHIIPYSFPEYPYWSFLHSDVHAHLLVHPFTIVFLYLLLSFIYSGNFLITLEDFKNGNKLFINIFYCILMGSFMLINSWNYPTAVALTFAGLYIHCTFNLPKSSIIVNILRIIPPILFYILLSYGVYLAFYTFFISPVEGFGFVDPATRTTLGQYLMLFGTFLFPICIFILSQFIYKLLLSNKLNIFQKAQIITCIIIVIPIVYFITKSVMLTLSIIFGVYFLIKLLWGYDNKQNSMIFAIMFLIFSLIISCEYIYVNDLFGGDYERQNTVAKSYIQILLLMPIGTTYIMYLIAHNQYLKGRIKQTYTILMTLLIICSSIFLYAGTYIKNNRFQRNYYEQNWHVPTLNGSKYINVKYDGEYFGIMWIKNNCNRNDVLLEAEGAPYSYYGRVSSQTGIPSLLNWGGSLNILRGKDFPYISNPRIDAINSIYKSINKTDIIKLVYNYNISYIFIGTIERLKYSPEELEGFKKENKLFKKIFQDKNTVIYKVIK